jgi:serine/threonine protein kinase
MLAGNPPWHELEGVAAIYRIVTADRQKYDLPADTTNSAREFIEQCFIRDAKKRPSADELLQHPFVCDCS